jgi:hypothetical protein
MTGRDALYRAFGLCFRSCLALPELLPAPAGSAATIEIVYGAVPRELPGTLVRGVRFQAAANALRLQVDGIATFLVEEGRRITIERAAGAQDDDVRVFLLGSAVGALLHQRRDLVLHASAVEWNGQAVAFLGRSGAGKSTLAAALRQRGHAVLTDDLCVIRPDAGGRMCAHPGFPQAKLWLDSLRQLALPPEGLRRIRHQLEKRAVPLAADFAAAALPVRQLYVLRPPPRETVQLAPVSGPAKFQVLRNQTYRFGFVADIDGKSGHFQHALHLAQQVPLTAITRSADLARLGELVAAIETDLGA